MKLKLPLLLLGLGCYATASQVHFVREFLAVFAGNELCLGVLFGCWFLGIVIGASLGGWIAARTRRGKAWLVSIGLVMVPALLGLVTLLRYWRLLTGISPGELPGLGALIVAGLLLITPFSLLVGTSFPLACRLSATNDDPLAIGRVYILESVGAIVGGLSVSVFLAGRLQPLGSMFLSALPLLAGLFWILAPASSSKARRFWELLLLAAVLGGWLPWTLLPAFQALDGVTSEARFDSLGTSGKRLAFADTPYQHLDLSEQGGQYNLFTNGKVAASFPDPYRTRPRAHLVLSEHPDPKQALLLGWASIEFIPPALLHPLERLDVVELDPAVLELLRPRLDPATNRSLDDPRVHFHATDARRFLRETEQTWDLVFSDAPDPTNAAENRFFTREFFRQVHARLSPGGVFVARLSSSFTVFDEVGATQVRTMQSTLLEVFAQVELLPGGETFFLATDQPEILLTDPARLGERYRQGGTRDPAFFPEQFATVFEVEQVPEIEARLHALGQTLQNTDARPASYLQSILRWSLMTGGAATGPLRFAAGVPAWIWFALLLPGAVPILLNLRRRASTEAKSRRAAAFAIGTIGALGLGLELVLTFAYQSVLGSLYQELGLIVAAFMAGLVAAGFLAQRALRRRPGGPHSLGWVLLALAAFTALQPLALSPALLGALPLGAGRILILLLVLCSGAGTGIVFPLASQLAVRSGTPLGMAAGVLDAVDHLGAAAGGLVTGVLLVPVLGRDLCCWWFAGLALLSGLAALLVDSRASAR